MTFFDKYSYRQKNYALIVLGILLVAASYKRVFKTTIETVNYKKQLKEKITYAQGAINEIKITQANINFLNKLLGKENITIEKVQQSFLNFLTINAKGIVVYQMDEVLNFKHPDFTINTHKIILKGDFISTLKFIYKLEKNFDLAKLTHVNFEFKKYNSEEKEDLFTTLLLQNYEK